MTCNPTSPGTLSVVSERFSAYRFLPRAVERDKLAICFEAAGWAASSFNEQPWRWIVSIRDDGPGFAKMLGCLLEANQGWAADAGALVLTAYRKTFSRNENPNRVALHDLGQAAAHLGLQATALGLQIHQMAGINLSQVRSEYQIPEEFEPATAIAIGYADTSTPSSDVQKSMAEREQGSRRRMPLADQVFSGTFGRSMDWS